MKDIIGLILAILILLNGCGTEPAQALTECSFSWQETEIQMHAEAATILETLGEPIGYTEEPSCAFEGLDKTYYFGSFYLTTYPKDGADYIQSLWFADDTVATAEGIHIGDTKDAVEAAYGSECFNGSNSYILTGNTSKMTILLTDGLVSTILYEAIF